MKRAIHGATCTIACVISATPSTLVRERPPAVPCPFCKAPAGIACHQTATKRPLVVFGRSHPSRLERVVA